MSVAVPRNGGMECHIPVWKLRGKIGAAGRGKEERRWMGIFYSSQDRRVAVGTPPLTAKPEPEWLLCDPVGIPSPCLTELGSGKDGGKCVKAGNYKWTSDWVQK